MNKPDGFINRYEQNRDNDINRMENLSHIKCGEINWYF